MISSINKIQLIGYNFDYINGISDHVLQTKGCEGVVRELLDCINNKKGE